MKGMTNGAQNACVVKKEEQQQEEGEMLEENEVHEEEEEDKEAQDDTHAEVKSQQEDGIATNIKVKEVLLPQRSSVHGNNPC